jgi:hypothetical protein
MSRKALFVHATLAIIALLAAYVAWKHSLDQGSDQEDEATVVVADIRREELEGITYRAEKRTVEIDLSKGQGPRWVEVTTVTKVPRPSEAPIKAAPPDPDAGAAPDASPATDAGPEPEATADGGAPDGDAAPAAPPEPVYDEQTTVKRFVASKALDEMLENLAPLKVVRRLGKLIPSQLEEFELSEPQATLELRLTNGTRVIQIGGSTFGGGNHHYVLDESNGEAYLMGAGVIRDLEMAQSRLFLRDLHLFEVDEIATATIIAGQRRRVAEQRNRQSTQDRAWVDAEDPEATDEALDTWMRAIERLRALTFPTEGEGPGPRAVPLVRIELKNSGGEEIGFLELARDDAEQPEFYGRSEATGAWAQLSRTITEQLIQDLDEVLGR